MAAEGEKEVIAFSFCTLLLVNIGTEYLLLIVSRLQRIIQTQIQLTMMVLNPSCRHDPVSTFANKGKYSHYRKKSTKLKK
jgi:hypothetical protein